MSQGYVRHDGKWDRITGVAYWQSGQWHTQDGNVWENGSWTDYTSDVIESLDGSTYLGDHFRGSESGNASLIPDAALATGKGSQQGLHCDGFTERYTLPGDNANPLYAGVESIFYFRPRKVESQNHFLLAPQEHYVSPPDGCYRFEFHIGPGGSRLAKMSRDDPSDINSPANREILDFENETEWEADKIYTCHFIADSSGIDVWVEDTNLNLTTSDSEYIDDVMGFGFRCGGNGMVDFDWLDYA